MTVAAFLQHCKGGSNGAAGKHPVLIMCAGNVSEATFDQARKLLQ